MGAKTYIIGIAMSLFFVILISLYYNFVLDDAYIIYRYAKNLAHNKGLVWNVSEDPVEGYTSFLWVILNSLAIRFHLSPAIFSKIVSSLSALAIIWILVFISKNANWWLEIIFIGAIALCPFFAFLAMQGMETIFVALLLLIAALLSIVIISRPSKKNIFYIYGIMLLCFLTRPDTAIFSFGLLVGLIIMFLLNRDYKIIRVFLLIGIIFVIIGSIYMIWRISYFGYFFPNTFYIKVAVSGKIIKSKGIRYVKIFINDAFLPHLFLIAFLMGRKFVKEKILKTMPIFLGCTFFILYLFTIKPIQGFFGRFIFPIYPAFLLAILYYFSSLNPKLFVIRRKWLALAVVMLFSLFTLRHIPSTLVVKKLRTQCDRVLVGKKLAALNGTMLVSESGALPYYSDWKAVDIDGLNSEEIAHKGLSAEILNKLSPDLIILHYSGKYRPRRIIHQYMIDHGFVAVAAIYKNFGNYHYYFVCRNSELFNEIVERLTQIKDLQYGNLDELIEEKDLLIYGQK
jgi:arabinofuranosyltransferase